MHTSQQLHKADNLTYYGSPLVAVLLFGMYASNSDCGLMHTLITAALDVMGFAVSMACVIQLALKDTSRMQRLTIKALLRHSMEAVSIEAVDDYPQGNALSQEAC